MEESITLVLREPSKPVYTKKQVRKLVHDAFKAGLVNTHHARHDNDLSGQNSRLFALKRLFPRIFTVTACGADSLLRKKPPGTERDSAKGRS